MAGEPPDLTKLTTLSNDFRQRAISNPDARARQAILEKMRQRRNGKVMGFAGTPPDGAESEGHGRVMYRNNMEQSPQVKQKQKTVGLLDQLLKLH